MSSQIGLLVGGVVVLLFAPGVHGQERVRRCQNTVASRLNIPPADVQSTTGPRLPTGNFIISWNARAGGDDMRGYCEVNRSNRVIDFQVGEYIDATTAGGNNGPRTQLKRHGRHTSQPGSQGG